MSPHHHLYFSTPADKSHQATLNGFGRHIETVSKAELTAQGKVGIGGIIFYILTHLALKLSILLQYVRISVMPFEKRFCYVIIAILVVQSLAMVGTHLALCRPFYALWTPNVPGQVCLDRTKVYYAQLGMTIVMDFAVLVAPLFILRHLRLPWVHKLLILVVLSFGGMYVFCSPLSLQSLHSIPLLPAPRNTSPPPISNPQNTQGLHNFRPPPPNRRPINPIQRLDLRQSRFRPLRRHRA